jgi:hypothetical protein
VALLLHRLDWETDMFRTIRKIWIYFLFPCLMVLTMMAPDPSLAQRKYRPEMVLPSHYPSEFDGFGRVDRIEGDEIVINDRLLRLSPRFTFSTKTSQRAAREILKVGDMVGFKKGSDGQVVSIWFIDPGPAGR